MRTGWLYWWVCALVHISGLVVFLLGFFPSKVVVPGFNRFATELPFHTRGKAHFDKVIVMVVDAMRSDFVFLENRSQMAFVHELIGNGHAVPFTAFSNPPTVTLPRLKGITTGGTPSFLDAILNVADDKDTSQGLAQYDSWVHQFKHHGRHRKIHFFGDDTWIKLFPPEHYFEKFEGTNSFFVSDFTEVDTNVTRHLDEELVSDWDGLILHYLGLDHIGHKGGPDSVYMGPKQQEMDAVVRRLYESMSKDTLLVLMGDHGMNEVGNHGASSLGETRPGLVFISRKFEALKQKLKSPLPDNSGYSFYKHIQQIDLVPTLAALLGFPVPKNSLGVVVEDFLALWPQKARTRVLYENCLQLKALYDAKGISDPQLEWLWNSIQPDNIDSHYVFMKYVQDELTRSSTDYNYTNIYYGLGLLVVAMVLTVGATLHYHVFVTSEKWQVLSFIGAFVVYAIHFHGSSLIEEEHQIWWFFAILALFVLATQKVRVGALVVLQACVRGIRSWSDSGQKFVSPATTSTYLLANPELLWLLNAALYLVLSFNIYNEGGLIDSLSIFSPQSQRHRHGDMGSFTAFILAFVFGLVSFSFKLCQYYTDKQSVPGYLHWLLDYVAHSSGSIVANLDKSELQTLNIQLSRAAFWGLCTLTGLRVVFGYIGNIKKGLLTDFANIIVLGLVHQSRPETIPVFLFMWGARWALAAILTSFKGDYNRRLFVVTGAMLILQNISFFSVGNTNLLATLDLSNAYNGVREYDVVNVGILTFISNYSTVIFWSVASLQLLFHPTDGISLPRELKLQILLRRSYLLLSFYAVGAVSLVASCINLRFHLFIWTVFSPKLLYFAGWSILVNVVVDVILAVVLLLAA